MRRAAQLALRHVGGLGILAAAAAVYVAVDVWLTARVAAGIDAAQQLAPVDPYIGVDRVYVAARALGITALLCSSLSVAAGLSAARRRDRGLAVPSAWTRLHRQLSVVTLVLAAGHATLPYLSVFSPFGGWPTATVPFAQPYSWGTTATWAESAGIIGFYLMLLLGPSYYLAKHWKYTWAVAHRLVLMAYLLVVTHTIALGSDFLTRGAPRVVLIGMQVPILLLLAVRLHSRQRHPGFRDRTTSPARKSMRVVSRRVASATVWVLAGAAAAVTGAGILGAGLGGFPLQHGP